MNREGVAIAVIVVVIISILVGLAIRILEASDRYQENYSRLMKECMDDGKPEYECSFLLRR